MPGGSDRFGAALPGADTDGFVDRRDEYLAVTDATCLGRVLDGIDNAFEEGILNHDLDFHLRQEIDDIFSAAIELGMAFLATESLCFQDGDALNADVVKRFLDLIELERLDDCLLYTSPSPRDCQ